MKINELNEAIEKLEESKRTIAIERDKMRSIYDEIGDILCSFDTGIDGLEDGIIEIRTAIDAISEVV